MAFDFKKEYKEFYMPKNKPMIVTIPRANYIAVRGQGDPNEEGGAYQKAISVLYAVAYTLKMSYKTNYKIEGFFEYVVPPLEGFWWQDGIESIDYDASKIGIISLTHNLAKYYAPRVRVNCICPGWVDTLMNKDLSKEQKDSENKKILLNRFAKPSEIANVIYFIASDEGSYINDAIIKVDGGRNND